MSHKPPEVQYDADMPPAAQGRFEEFMRTVIEHPETMRHILDVHPTNDALVAAATTADTSTESGKALALFGEVVKNGDEQYVEPNETLLEAIGKRFDRAEQYGNRIDRQRTWFDTLILHAQVAAADKAREAVTHADTPVAAPVTIPAATAESEPVTAVTAGATTKTPEPVTPQAVPEPLPEVTKEATEAEADATPEPEDDTPVTITLIPPDGRRRPPIEPVTFMAPEYPE